MARRPRPIRPRLKDSRLYEKALRQAYYDPMMRRLRDRLAQAEAANQAYAAMGQVVTAMAAEPEWGVPKELIQKHLDAMQGYHKAQVIKTFRAALAIDISPLLKEPTVAAFMAQKIRDNVDLVKTIPKRMHDSLKKRLDRELAEAPFDQKRMMDMFRKEYGSSGYNLRRITRDQSQKLIGGLTEVRHRELGIEGYEWLTSRDERVRPTHRDNDGKLFLWSNPPAVTGPPGRDIQCRCVAIPMITPADKERLRAATR